MTEETSTRQILSAADISKAVRAVADETAFDAMARRLIESIRVWASPSVIVCLCRDPSAEPAWRTIPELTHGTVTPAFESSIVRLIEESPHGSLDKPVIVRPQDEVPGTQVKVRDNWIVPCRRGDVDSYLFIRGINPPYPENFGYAVELASAPLWPHLQRSPRASSMEAAPSSSRSLAGLSELVENLTLVTGRVMEGLREERESLHAESKRQESASRERDASAEKQAAELRESVRELTEQVATLEKRHAALVEEKETAEREAAPLRTRIEELEKQPEAERAPDEESAKLRLEIEELKEKIVALEKERSSLSDEKNHALQESDALKARIEELEKRPEAERAPDEESAKLRLEIEELKEKSSALTQQNAEAQEVQGRLQAEAKQADEARADAEARLKEKEREIEDERVKIADAADKTSVAEKGRLAAEAERDRAKAETHRLWGSIESLQKQLTAEKGQHESSNAALKRERELLKTALDTANERLSSAEARAIQIEEKWKGALDSFLATAEALRRTPFVPPMLRVAFSGAEGVLAAQEPSFTPSTSPKPTHLLFLDREPHKLDNLAGEIEKAGIEVLIAHYPEEVSFFLKTPEAKRITGLVCDVMAFRADQDIMDIMRLWRQDLSSLALLVSFQAESATETEKAQRLPVAMVAGYLPRPLEKQAVQDAVAMIVRRQFGRMSETPVPRANPERQRT